jgi:hypothetical protein
MLTLEAVALSVAVAGTAAMMPKLSRAAVRGENDSLWLLYSAAPFAFLSTVIFITAGIARSRGLWLDEYGTLWVIGGSVAEVAERAYAFQGQSPFYYYVPWVFTKALGTSEDVLRMPSFLLVVVASMALGATAVTFFGRRAFNVTVVFTWSMPPILDAAVDARPYALALLGYSCAWLGFARAVQGLRWSRVLFVIGGIGMFYAHYVLAVFLLGFAAAHAWVPSLRRRYTAVPFLFDSLIVSVLCLPGLPHLYNLWTRRGALDWLPSKDYAVALDLVAPALAVLAVGLASSVRARLWTDERLRAAIIASAIPLLGVLLAVAAGPNLLAPRYLLPSALGASLCSAGMVGSLPPRARRFAVTLFVSLAFIAPAVTSSLAIGITQDWSAVRRIVDEAIASDNDLTVLYRSGFVEQDTIPRGSTSPVDLAPLNPPGLPPLRVRIVPLTYTWSADAESRLRATAVPALEQGRPLIFVSTRHYTSRTGAYDQRVVDWLAERNPRIEVTKLDCCAGVDVIRFESHDSSVKRSVLRVLMSHADQDTARSRECESLPPNWIGGSHASGVRRSASWPTSEV